MKARNSGTKKGGLFCQLNDHNLNKYLMGLAADFQRGNPNVFQNPKLVPSWHGRQEDNVWVLNEDCQIDKHGNLMDDTRYKWLAHYTSDEEMKKLIKNQSATETEKTGKGITSA